MRVPAALLLLVAPSLHAQATAGLVPCRGQRIDSISIEAVAPTVTGVREVPVVGSVARAVHIVTRPDVVRGYLLLRLGDPCTELRRAESERILRAQPFIADATIDVIANDRGGVDLDVHTVDEVALVLSGSMSGTGQFVRAAKVGSINLAGLGVATSVGWRHQRGFDDRLELRASDHQFAGRPYVLSLSALREPLGREDRAELTLPFRTDVQRYAWRTVVGGSRGHATFQQRDSGLLALGVEREYAETGGIIRIGPPGKLTLFGLSITNERSWPDTTAERITDTGMFQDTAAGFTGRFVETHAARVNALLGLRGLRFMRVRALDAIRATQDVPVGLQLGTLVGRGVPALGASSDDIFIASDLYLGFGTPRVTYRLQFQGEGRQARGSREWDGLVGSGRVARHSRVSDRRTRILAAEWSGTSRVLVPHAMSLSASNGGLRGYDDLALVGARRLIGRWDERMFLGSPFDLGDLAVSLFVDVGHMWAGDLPYGESTPFHEAIGASLLFGLPMRSTRTWRLELAAPLQRLPGLPRWELRFSHRDMAAFFWREPADVNAARARAVPASVYNWP